MTSSVPGPPQLSRDPGNEDSVTQILLIFHWKSKAQWNPKKWTDWLLIVTKEMLFDWFRLVTRRTSTSSKGFWLTEKPGANYLSMRCDDLIARFLGFPQSLWCLVKMRRVRVREWRISTIPAYRITR
jgi:hypothetical protein